MPPRLDVPFTYTSSPRILVRVTSPLTGRSITLRAFIDTGADRTAFDSRALLDIDLDPELQNLTTFEGVGGGSFQVGFYSVELALLSRDDLTVTLPITFAANLGPTVGNLIGLDVLEHFDFALAHRDRLGYLGRR
jgi:hypothetical protein